MTATAFTASDYHPALRRLSEIVCLKADRPTVFGDTAGRVAGNAVEPTRSRLGRWYLDTAYSGLNQPLPQSHVFPTGRVAPSPFTKRWLCSPRHPVAQTEAHRGLIFGSVKARGGEVRSRVAPFGRTP